jgi:acetyl-CoA carboxylase beta subunit
MTSEYENAEAAAVAAVNTPGGPAVIVLKGTMFSERGEGAAVKCQSCGVVTEYAKELPDKTTPCPECDQEFIRYEVFDAPR